MQTIRTNLVNPSESPASGQYTNFNFTSMCVFNGVVLGAGPEGLFKACCGPDDNGVDIDAYFVPVTWDFDEQNKKSIGYLNFMGRCDGSMSFSITADEDVVAGPYLAAANTEKGTQRLRVKCGRGLKFFYASIKIGNVDGSFFAVDRIGVVSSVTKHGVR